MKRACTLLFLILLGVIPLRAEMSTPESWQAINGYLLQDKTLMDVPVPESRNNGLHLVNTAFSASPDAKLGASSMMMTDYFLNSNQNVTINCGVTDNFYDSGGPGGSFTAGPSFNAQNYSNNQNFAITFCSSNGATVIVDFSNFKMETDFDFVNIFDGNSTAAPSLGSFTGDLSPFTVESTGNCITVQIDSDNSFTWQGWEATVYCGVLPTGPGQPACAGADEIGGIVYEDLNGNGKKDPKEEPLSGVSVFLYNDAGQVGGAQLTNSNGEYVFNGLAAGDYRVEIAVPSTHEPAPVGMGSNTSVQFLTAGACNGNIGLMVEEFFCQEDVKIVTNCYVRDDNTSGGDVLISFDYFSPASVDHEADATNIATTYGLAYQRASNTMFASAYQKRFSGYGNGSPASIYIIPNPTDGNVSGSEFLNLGTLFGNPAIAGTDPHDFVTTTLGGDIIDGPSFAEVGRMSFGDMDYDEDNNSLWVMNLEDRSLYQIPLGPDPTNPVAPASSAAVTVVDVVNGINGADYPVGTTLNEVRPFATKVRDGNVYVGLVTNGEDGGPLWAQAYAYNISGNTFTKVLEFPLNYARGCAFANTSTCAGPADWNAWIDAWPVGGPSVPPWAVDNFTEEGHPQAVFTDIEFAKNGDMIIGLRDRMGDQGGADAPHPNGLPYSSGPFTSTLFDQDAFGDILRATYSGGNWTLNISDFTDNTLSVAIAPTSEPVLGSDDYFATGYLHEETAMGGVAVNTAVDQFITPSMDPDVNAFSNGLDWFDVDGYVLERGFEVLTGGINSPFGKSYGLGDVELLCGFAPIEVGNRVWKDEDSDGIQDPADGGINGVVVELWKETSPSTYQKVAETTTAADGEQGDGYYVFSAQGAAGQNWSAGAGLSPAVTEVEPGMNYEIRIALTSVQAQDVTILGLTAANQNSDASNNNKTDLADSDATDDAGTAKIAFSTTTYGSSNHTLDAGYSAAPPVMCSLNAPTILATCDDAGTPSDPSDDTFTYTIEVTGTDVGASYSISGDDSQTGLSYGATEGPFGPFPISSGDLTITVTDVDDAGCQLVNETVSAPATCSAACVLNAPSINATCDDNGTPSDPSDDTFTYTINVTGANTGASYSISGDDSQTGLSYGATEGPFGPFPISGGDLTITVTDVDDAGCQLVDETVMTPDNTCAPVGICASNEYIYLADALNGLMHKFLVNPDGTLTEIPNGTTNTIPWLPTSAGIVQPHGVVMDRNGNLYTSTYPNADGFLYQLDCDGAVAGTNVEDLEAFNMVVVGDYIFSTAGNGEAGTTVRVHNLCDGVITEVGHVNILNQSIPSFGRWGMAYNPSDGLIYVTDNYGFGNPVTMDGDVYAIDPTNPEDPASVWQTNASIPPVITGRMILFGITFDNDNNMYVVEQDSWTGPSKVLKYAYDGTNWNLVLTSATDNTNTTTGYYNAWGIRYSAAADKIYVTSRNEDCIAQFNPTTLAYEGAAVPHVPGQDAKALDIVIEGCYSGPATIDVTLCTAETVLLRDLIGCPVCGGTWTRTSGTGGVFDLCNLTFDPSGSTNSQFVFTGNNAICGPFNVTVNVEYINPTAIVTPGQGTCTGIIPNDDATIALSSVVNGDEAGISLGATYSGPVYGDAANIDVSGGTGSFTGLMHSTQYTVRVFNGANDCFVDETVMTPSITCATCTLNAPIIVATCNDNGTPSDPSDDTFEYTIEVTGANTGASYSISGDDSQTGLSYGATEGPFGPFPISGGDLTITITDVDDAGCQLVNETVSAPATCSAACVLNAPSINATCDDNGTPSDPSDDTFTYTINVTGSNTGASYSISGDDSQTGLSYGATEGPFGPFPISGGDLTITITDVDDAGCQLVNETVSAPATCSAACVLNAPSINATCDDNGTPFDSSDDTFSYTIEVSGANTGATYSISGDDTQSGLSYGATEGPFGPFPISGGDLTITITDVDDAGCQLMNETVSAPAVCSVDCQMVVEQVIASPCEGGMQDLTISVSYMDEPTTEDIVVTVNGSSTNFTNDGSGFQTFNITGVSCAGPVMVTAAFETSTSCSDVLVYTPVTAPPTDPQGFIYCEETGEIITGGTISVMAPNNGTVVQILLDGSDGEYSFDVLSGPYGDFQITYMPPVGYALSVLHTATPGTLDLTTFNGGADIFLGQDENLAGTALDGFNPATYQLDNPFYLSVNIEAGDPHLFQNNIPLSGCCVLEDPIILATCDDNGTTDPSDDTYSYTIELPSNGSSGASYSISGDDTQNGLAYDVPQGPFGPFAITGGDLTITITDDTDGSCQLADLVINAPAECSDCALTTPDVFVNCSNKGTTDPTDDTFRFSLRVNETTGTGSTFSISGDYTEAGLPYGVVVGPFDPYLITDGDLTITITDDGDGSCQIVDLLIAAPSECSDCSLSGPDILVTCDDQGTSDPTDDTFTFLIRVNETTGLGETYALSGDVVETDLDYGVDNGPFGPFLITDGNLTITITDESDPNCEIVDAVVAAPLACSPACELTPVIETACDDQGTADPSDDRFYFTVFLPLGSGSVASNGFNISGDVMVSNLDYGTVHGPFGNFLISDGPVDITITDLDDPTCTDDFNIVAPMECSDPCTLDPVITVSCDNQGTIDPTDDTYSYSILVLSGLGTGANYSISGDDTQGPLAYNVVNGPYGPFLITDGDLSINITDGDDPTCQNLNVAVAAPMECSPLPASIGNFVWEDANANGVQDPGEMPLSNVLVTLDGTDIFGNLVTNTDMTDVNGNYLFDNLVPGDYKLTFTTPTGYEPTANDQGNDLQDSDANPLLGGMTVFETLTEGEENLSYDAGFYLPAELGNYTWIDANLNGQQDLGEQPIGGVVVVLNGTTGSGEPVNETQITDINGFYLFENLTPGTYKVSFETPNGNFESTFANIGDDASDSDANPAMGGMTGDYTLASGDSDLTVDAGYWAPASIGNFVWEDLNANGQQDIGEPGIANVQVILDGTDVFGNPVVDVTTTDVDGSYLFDNLVPGDYKLTFATPAGYSTTTVDFGGDDTNDSDADPSMAGMTAVETLTSGENNTDYDAGYYLPAELGNYTWVDANYNGTQDPGEAPISGIEVTLTGTTGAGVVVNEMAMTDVDGLYLFTGLAPGTYKVTFGSAGGDYELTEANDPQADDATDSDADAGMGGMTGNYTLESGDSDLTVDAGYYEPASIGDFVFVDENGNGLQDPGEPGIGGVEVELTGTDGQGTPVSQSKTTEPDGTYSFTDLKPGEYKLTFTTPAGYTTADVDQGGDDADDSDADPTMGGMTAVEVLTSGEDNTDYDAGYYLPAELGNYTWIDDNVNGQQDPGEQPLAGVVVILDGTTGSGEVVQQTQTTDANGLYLFTGLQPGTYKVTFETPNGTYVTTLVNTGDDATDSDADPAMGGMTGNYTLASGDSDLSVDAGFYEGASIGNFVWEDVNGNGQQDPGEPGIQGVEVTLTGTDQFGNPVTQTTTTDVDGSYLFDDLVPGDYKLTFATPVGYTTTDVDQGGDDTMDSDADPAMGGMTVVETLTSGENNTDYDAGYYLPAELGNYTWVDANYNGTQDPGEAPISGIEVTLTGTTGSGEAVSETATTDANGLYLFTDLQPGTYKVTFGSAGGDYELTEANDPQADDATDSDADAGMGGMTGNYTLESGDSDLTVDAGYYEPASIGDFVFVDENGNGLQDPGEPGIGGVTVELTGTDGQGNPVSETTTTNPDGSYLFDDLLPGEYKLTFTTPAGYTTADVNQGGDDSNDSDADPTMGGMTAVEVLTSGEDNTDYDAGYYLPAELGDFVWLDADANGTQDVGEPGISNVTVILDGTTGSGEVVQQTQLTDADGAYLFTNLQPGTYKVTFQAPAGLMLTEANDGDATDATDSDADPSMGGMTGNYTLASGDSELTVDAGYFGGAAIGDYVWNDLNANGIQDPNEPGIAGVSVQLTGTDNQGNPVDQTTTTAADGSYLFDGLAAGSYKLTFTQPGDFDFASPADVGDDASDSDADPLMGGMTVVEVLESGEVNLTYDAGYYQCPEITVFGLPLAPVCPGEPIDPLTLVTEPGAAMISWTGGAAIGLMDGSGAGPVLEIPAFATTAEGSPIITVTAILGECTITSTFQLVVDDSVDPGFANCPENFVVNNDVDKCGANVLWEEPVAFDACGSVATDVTQTAGPAPGSFIGVDESPVTVTYEANDGNGNTMTCSFTVSVADMQLPSLSCPSGVQHLPTNGSECAFFVNGSVADILDGTATDNCEIVSMTHDYSNAVNNTTLEGAFFPEGSSPITWTAVDASGNELSCSYTVRVTDDDAAIILTCPDDIVVDNDPGVCGATVEFDVVFRDNCDGDELDGDLMQGLPSGATFPVGTTQEVFQYVDGEENGPTICAFTVTVNDVEDPTITCPENAVVELDGTVSGGPVEIMATGPCGVTLRYHIPLFDDNCSANLELVSGQGVGPNYYAYGGIYTEEWDVTDASGNVAECEFKITVLDPITPTITCPVDFTVENDPSVCGAVVTYANPVATDNCPGYTVELTNGLPSGSVFPVGTTTVEFTVTDVFGNVVTCGFDVTVEDTEGPVVTCPADQEVLTSTGDLGDCAVVIPDLVAQTVASDNCTDAANLTITQEPAAGTDYNGSANEVIEVTITVTDEFGNTSSCLTELTIIDDEFPTIDCSNLPTVFTADPGQCDYTVTDNSLDPPVTDNCQKTRRHDYVFAPQLGTLEGATFPVGETEVTWLVRDLNGNLASCMITITVTDDEDPVFVNCPEDLTVNNDVDKCGANVIWSVPVVDDNCDIQNLVQTDGPLPGNYLPVGTTTITYEVTDVNGNTNECSFDIEVLDTQLPSLSCPAGVQNLPTNGSECGFFVNESAADILDGVATDNCQIISMTHDFNNAVNNTTLEGAFFPEGNSPVIWTAVDAAGNELSCTYTVRVSDDDAAIVLACPDDIVVDNDADVCGAVVEFEVLFRDNCDGDELDGELVQGLASGSVFPVGTTQEVFQYVDGEENGPTLCAFTVTVNDVQQPLISCPADIEVETDGSILSGSATVLSTGPCGLTLSYTAPVGTDNCDAVTSLAGGQGAQPNYYQYGGTYTESWIVTDASGNTASCSFTITVADPEPPTLTCPVDFTVFNDPGACGAVINYAYPIDNDNCPGWTVALTQGLPSGSEFPVGTTLVEFTVTDAANNSMSCDFEVTVLDNEGPQVTCPADQEVLTSTGDLGDCAVVIPDLVAQTIASDNCTDAANLTITQEPAAGTDYNGSANEVIEVTITVTDEYGNSVSCVTELTIIDDEFPTIDCSNLPTVFTADPGQCGYTVTDNSLDPPVTDNCQKTRRHDYVFAPQLGTLEGATFPVGETEVTWFVKDLNGNLASCMITITVTDDEDPVFVNCPEDLTVNNDVDKCGANVIWSVPVADDNCGIQSLVQTNGPAPGNFLPSGVTTITYLVTDINGNDSECSFDVEVLDTQLPGISCPTQFLTQSADANCEWVVAGDLLDPDVYDNCAVTSISNNYNMMASLDGATFALGTTTVIWTISDAADNSVSCSYVVSVIDDSAPVVEDGTCPGDIEVDNDADVCGAVVEYTIPTFSDNCDGVGLSGTLMEGLTSGATFPIGTTTVTYSYTDAAGNDPAICSFTVTVNDVQNPTINCPADIVVGTDGSITSGTATIVSTGPCGVTLSYQAPIGLDNCAGAITSLEGGQGSQPNYYEYGGFYTETWMVTDASGNTATCSFTITVEDPEPPTITCPVDFTLDNDPGVCGAVVNYAYPIDADNCPGWSVALTDGLPSGSVFPVGMTMVQFTITDDASNETTCSFVVTVEDTEGPVISDCPADREVSADANCMAEVPNMIGELLATDNCTDVAGLTITQDPVAGTLFGGAHGDEQVVTFTVTDEYGNSSTCTMTLTLVDATNPSIDCSMIDTDRVADTGLCSFTMPGNGFDPVFDDNCAATISHNYVFAPNNNTLAGATFPVGTTNVTWTATDANGNTATCNIVITITDEEDPVFVNCPTQMVMIGNDPDQCSGKVNWSIPVALDNCGIQSVEQSTGPVPGSTVPVCELNTITYTATDVNGNTSTCSFEVLVIDTQAPELDDDIVMPGDITVECDAVPAPFVLTNDDVRDNCTAPEDLVIEFTEVSTQDPDPATCGHYEYTITRTWTVTDEACALGGGSNVYTHVQIIDVEDTTAPDAVCMDITIALDKFGNASITGADIDGGSTDNCAAPEYLTLIADPNTFTCADLGANTVTLTVTDPCGNTSTCTAIVTVEEDLGSCEPMYDYANSIRNECLNNASSETDGQFYELIQVHALAGQTWTVTSVDGLFAANSAAPPATPTLIPVGTELTNGMSDNLDNDGDGEVDEFDEMVFYYLEGIHVDCQGYEVTLTNDLGQTLTVANKGCYPTPYFSNLYGPYCLNTPPFEILVEDANGAVAESIEIFINGEPTNIFDAAALGEGTYTIKATFDAGEAASFLVVNGEVIEGTEEGTETDPGCQQMITEAVQVVGTPTQVACNDFIQVSLEEDCESIITPDMVLEGSYFCYDDYEVILTYPVNTNSYDPANVVDGTHVGLTLQYTLNHTNSGNICWGELLVEDKLDPVVECPADIEIFCLQDPDNTLVTGLPAVEDCSATTTSYTDEVEQFTCAENQEIRELITRTFTVVDAYGNATSCTQQITVRRADFEDIVFPGEVNIECTEVQGGATPEITGWPQINGVDLISGQTGGCNLGLTYEDHTIPTCEGAYTIERTWKVVDQCTPIGTQSYTVTQFINVYDVAPSIEITVGAYDPVNDWYVMSANGTGNDGNCAAFGPVPFAEITDGCNQIVSVTVNTPAGQTTNGGSLQAPGLPEGIHQITYTAEDACEHITELTITVLVTDNVAPTAICDEITDVALDSDGNAIVLAETFDDGSYDNCCLDEFLVRRMDGDCQGNPDDFGPSVEFCCSDIEANPILVVFRVVDCNGNVNDCMVSVEVEDKLPPVVSCPANETITCDEYLEELDAAIQAEDYSLLDDFGAPTFYDNCEAIVDYQVNVALNTCVEGTIKRTWSVTDPSGNGPATCTQTITVEHVSDWVVEFPADITAECTDGELPELGEPQIFFDECELVAVTHEDAYFYIVPDACYKLVRTWTVINWCVYDDYGYDVWTEAGYAECDLNIDFDGDGDQDCRTFRDGYNTSGTPGTPDGLITYEQTIKVIDNDPPVFSIPEIDGCIVETDCDKDLLIPYPMIEDQCSPNFEVDITGDFGPFNDIQGDITIDNVVPGIYNIYYSVTDNCGNTSYDDVTVVVEDCKKPTPYCKNGLIVEIMQTGMVEVWALDINDGSFDNCPGDLQYSFSSDVNDVGVTFDCDDLGPNTVQMWVTDAAGNQDFCEVNILLQDNMGVCNGVPLTIAGVIATEEDATVENVLVEVNGGLISQTTGTDGAYSFQLVEGQDYSITPMLDADHGNGVTTYDLVLITQHILGINPLDSPYKLIAADANNSQSITTLDMVTIRKVILLIDDAFANNTSWRFVDADYNFPQPTNPWAEVFPELLNYNNLQADDLQGDFVAVKIGDVNGTAVANSQQALQENTKTGALQLRTDEQQLIAGQTVLVPITAEQVDLLGYQFTLGVRPEMATIESIQPGLMNLENFGSRFQQAGILTASWNQDLPMDLPAGTVLFTLELSAKKATDLSKVLYLASGYTPAEAYQASGQLMEVALEVGASTAVEGFVLYQNTPNPFRQVTTIGFELPTASDARLTITDVNGKTIRVIEGSYQQGYNEIRLKELKYSGVLIYTLETADHRATKRMIATH